MLLALVLFLVAVSQRFMLRGVRIAVIAVAIALLAYAVYAMASLPRL